MNRLELRKNTCDSLAFESVDQSIQMMATEAESNSTSDDFHGLARFVKHEKLNSEPHTSLASGSTQKSVNAKGVRPLADESAQFSLDDSNDEVPKTQVLLPIERLVVPAKRPTDQPLVKYDIDSDEEERLLTKKMSREDKKPQKVTASREVKSGRLLTDEFEVELDLHDESDSEDLDLIPPPPLSSRRSWMCCDTKRMRCATSSGSCVVQ